MTAVTRESNAYFFPIGAQISTWILDARCRFSQSASYGEPVSKLSNLCGIFPSRCGSVTRQRNGIFSKRDRNQISWSSVYKSENFQGNAARDRSRGESKMADLAARGFDLAERRWRPVLNFLRSQTRPNDRSRVDFPRSKVARVP